MNKRKVAAYLARLDFDIRGDGRDVVTIRRDASCEMASVDINGQCLMVGNYWDFHNGCHGMWELPSFSSFEDLARIASESLGAVTQTDEAWRYES